MAIRGDRPSAVVVRCPSVAVALRYRRRQLATGGVPPWRAVNSAPIMSGVMRATEERAMHL